VLYSASLCCGNPRGFLNITESPKSCAVQFGFSCGRRTGGAWGPVLCNSMEADRVYTHASRGIRGNYSGQKEISDEKYL